MDPKNDPQRTKTAAPVTTQPVSDALLPRFRFTAVLDEKVPGPNLELPSASEVSAAGMERQKQELAKEERRNGKNSERYQKLAQDLRQDLRLHAARLDAVLDLLTTEGLDLSSSAAVDQAARDRTQHLQKTFDKALADTLQAQRPLEQNVLSINSFFLEGGCDGEAKSVYVINHNPITDELALSLGETSVQEMPADPALGNVHPIWGSSVDRDGNPMPVTFRPIDAMNVIQTMAAAMVMGANFSGQRQMDYWARHAAESLAVAFVNVHPDDCGREAWDPARTPIELRRNYTKEDDNYKSVVAVANHPVVRERLKKYEEADILAYPAFALLGRVYKHGKFDRSSSMTVSPINPNKDSLSRDWIKKLNCPWVRNRRDELNQIHLAFIDESSNRLGDDVVIHFNSATTAFASRRTPFTVKMGENWLQKVVTHHMLQNVGAANTDYAARTVGRDLDVKLKGMASTVDNAKPFVAAWVDWENSKFVREVLLNESGEPVKDENGQPIYTGKSYQEHKIHVQYRDGVENFVVRIAST